MHTVYTVTAAFSISVIAEIAGGFSVIQLPLLQYTVSMNIAVNISIIEAAWSSASMKALSSAVWTICNYSGI